MKRLIIDLDDVICGEGFLYLVNEYLQTSYLESDINEYYLQNLIPDDMLSGFYEFFQSSNLYDHCVLFSNAVEVIEKLNNKYELYICSSYIVPGIDMGLGMFIKEKYEWLRENLPFLKPSQIIFMSSKNIIETDIRIDDRLNHLEGSGTVKILFTAHHNINITDEELKEKNVVRANSWLEIEKILL